MGGGGGCGVHIVGAGVDPWPYKSIFACRPRKDQSVILYKRPKYRHLSSKNKSDFFPLPEFLMDIYFSLQKGAKQRLLKAF